MNKLYRCLQGVHVLYTGDYSMEDDRHLMAAEMPSTSPDVLIVESTYGVQVCVCGGGFHAYTKQHKTPPKVSLFPFARIVFIGFVCAAAFDRRALLVPMF